MSKITETQFQLSEAGLLTGINASIADQSGAILANSATAAASIARAVYAPSIDLELSKKFKKQIDSLNNFQISRGEVFKVSDLKKLSIPGANLDVFRGVDGKVVDKNVHRAIDEAKEDLKNPCFNISKLIDKKKYFQEQLVIENDRDKIRQKHNRRLSEIKVELESLISLKDAYSSLGLASDKEVLMKRIRLLETERDGSKALIKSLGESSTDNIVQALAKIKDELLITTSLDFSPSLIGDSSVVIELSDAEIRRIIGDVFDVSGIKFPEVNFSVNPVIDTGKENLTPSEDNIGIAYRIPVPSEVKASYILNNKERTIFASITNVPQFGPIGSLNLKNEPFDDNVLEVAFNPTTGSPSRVFFKAKSKGEAASAAARDVAGTYFQFQKDRQSDRVEARKMALDIAADEVSLDKSLVELGLTRVKSDVEAAQALNQLMKSNVEAEIQFVRDQQRLQAVRAGTATASEIELEALKTQEAILMQKLNILKLENDIAEQQIRSGSISVD